MQIKTGVNIQGIDIKMRKVLIWAANIWDDYGQELVVTAGLDGTHCPGSLHYYGLALDFRTRYFSDETIRLIAKKLRTKLGVFYDVVIHKRHIHVEYDPATGILP